jgi:hypothetical protein
MQRLGKKRQSSKMQNLGWGLIGGIKQTINSHIKHKRNPTTFY